MAKIDAFISHSPFDKRLAEGLRYVLASAGMSSWLDCAEVATGEQIPVSVRKAADNCRCFCAVITPRYDESWYSRMTAELANSRDGGRHPVKVVPCLMEGEPPAFLTEERFIDFRKDPARAQVELAAELRGYKNGHPDHGTWAVVGAAAAFLGTILLASNSRANEREEAQSDYYAWLLGLANHRALGRALSSRGMPVPASKDDRISALLVVAPMEEALEETLTATDVARICRVLDMPATGSKVENIRHLLGE
jgi:hypothetical protein